MGMRQLRPDAHWGEVDSVNSDGSLQIRRPGWSGSIRVPVRGGVHGVQPGQTVPYEHEDGDPQRPFYTAGPTTAYAPIRPLVNLPAFARGLWTQAEGQPELAGSSLQADFVISWEGRTFGGYVYFDPPPNASYLFRGHVYWPLPVGMGQAIACWLDVGGDWTLSLRIYLNGVPGTIHLGKYVIVDHGGLLSQGGATYDGGTDHGGLALHYSRAVDALICFGPLTHPDGRMHVYHCSLAPGAQPVRSTLPKMAIHTSLGHRDVLIGWWGGSASPSYYNDRNVHVLRFQDSGALQIKATLAISELTPGNWVYGCHPNGTRARGRWPWRPTYVDGVSTEGRFAVAARSAQTGIVFFGGGTVEVDNGVFLPDPTTSYTIKTDQMLHLWMVSPNATRTLLFDNRADLSSVSINFESLAWYEGNTSYPSLTTGYEQLQLGWPNDGDVRISVYDAELGGDRIVHGPLLRKLDAPHFVHPMLERNPKTRSDGNEVFEWVPATLEQQPVGTYSAKGWHVLCYSVPQYEIFGSPYFNAFFAYFNTAWRDWLAEYEAWGEGGSIGPAPPEPAHFFEERWRTPQMRVWYRTNLLVHNESDGAVCNAEISQSLTGLRDGPVLGTYLDYAPRQVLDQIYQAALFGQLPGNAIDRDGMQAVAIVRDWRIQDDTGPSEPRPVLQLLDHLADGALISEHELSPSLDRFDEGNAKFAKILVGAPVLRHGMDLSAWPWIDVITQWRDRTSAEDIAGDPDTHILRVTQLRWDDSHATLAEAVVTHTDFPGLALSEQALEGLAYAAGTPLVQTENLLQGFD